MSEQSNIADLFPPPEIEMSQPEMNGAGRELLTPVLIEGELRILDTDLARRL